MSLQIFSARLIDLMQFNNLSKHKLADETGAQRKSVINWVEGRNYPRPNMLIKLANYFRVSTDYLVGLSDTNGRGDYVCKLEYEEIQPRLIAILEDYMKCKHFTKYANIDMIINAYETTTDVMRARGRKAINMLFN